MKTAFDDDAIDRALRREPAVESPDGQAAARSLPLAPGLRAVVERVVAS